MEPGSRLRVADDPDLTAAPDHQPLPGDEGPGRSPAQLPPAPLGLAGALRFHLGPVWGDRGSALHGRAAPAVRPQGALPHGPPVIININ